MDALVLQSAALLLTVATLAITAVSRLTYRRSSVHHDALSHEIEQLSRLGSHLDEHEAQEIYARLIGIADGLDKPKRLAVVSKQSNVGQ